MAGGMVDNAYYATEVVVLVETNSTPSFGQLPSTRNDAFGTMLGNTPLLCGGYDPRFDEYFDNCISYHQDTKWKQSNLMTTRRVRAAVVKVNTTAFWILGGHYDDGYIPLDSTEFIIQGQNHGVPGPILPYGMYSMCAVKRSENEIFVIGGENKSSAKKGYNNAVWIYDPQNGFARTQGPSLTIARIDHSCSIMKDGKKTLIIIAGGSNNGQLDSVEIYDPTNNTWHSGKNKFPIIENLY